MAILKHIASKNPDYGKALQYLMFQHDEFTQKPILDSAGNMVMREEFYLDGINCDPSSFDTECEILNAQWKKNRHPNEIRSHHYIISFDPQDVSDPGLTGEWAQRLGIEYAEDNFPGHQALVCTHMDGHNRSGNIHVHIVINSLRKYDVERQDFMERPCDCRAGNKHHLTKRYLVHLKQSVMDLCHREGLHQVDLLAPARRKVTEKEYWAGRRGQEELNRQEEQIPTDSEDPQRTRYQTQKDFLRSSIDAAASIAKNLDEFRKILSEKYDIRLKISRGRSSYLPPERTKYITGRMLGTDYEKDHLLKLFTENTHRQIDPERSDPKNRDPAYSRPDPVDEKLASILYIRSDLHLVVDLQDCLKAQQSSAYANKVKLSNLKEMAKTVAYIQEHGHDTRDSLDDSLAKVREQVSSSRKTLRSIEGQLWTTNEQIHYTGQYLGNKSVYQQFCRAKNKGQFRKGHSAEITLYETARKFLQEQSIDGKLPSMKLLKEERAALLKKKKEAQEIYHYHQEHKKKLDTVCSNVDMILGRTQSMQMERQKNTDRS